MTQTLPDFISGMDLCKIFYHEAVRPILDKYFPQVIHSAARLDYGSDVLGFDTPQSRDHGWGPKMMLFLSHKDKHEYQEAIADVMTKELPTEIRGYPTNFDEPFTGEGTMQAVDHGPIRHWVAVETVSDFFEKYIGIDPTQPMNEVDWLTIPQMHLRTISSGVVFHDGLNLLEEVCIQLNWFPRDFWLYLLANQWRRIDQEEPFMGRCGHVGDELGSRVIASRQIIEIMKLCFLMEREYLPYNKWFGTAFSHLACAPNLAPLIHRVFDGQTWHDRENHLSKIYIILGDMHNTLGLTLHIEPEVTNFYNRPYKVPHSSRFVEILHDAIQSRAIKELPKHIGSVGQFVDSTDILSDLQRSRKLIDLFR